MSKHITWWMVLSSAKHTEDLAISLRRDAPTYTHPRHYLKGADNPPCSLGATSEGLQGKKMAINVALRLAAEYPQPLLHCLSCGLYLIMLASATLLITFAYHRYQSTPLSACASLLKQILIQGNVRLARLCQG